MKSPRVADLIHDQQQAIVNRWLTKVNQQIPEAQERSRPIIKNSVPELLGALALALASEDPEKVVHKSYEHGHDRAKLTDYSVDQVVKEYRLLQQTIFSAIDEASIDITARERDSILDAIDEAVQQATSAFVLVHNEKNQQAVEEVEKLVSHLEARNELRDQFIVSLSHDIRTPLANTQQLVDLLEDHLAPLEDAFVKKVLRGIRLSAQQGTNLINTLMDVNLIQSGNPLPLQKQRSDLLAITKDFLDSLKPKLRERITLDSSQEEIVGYWDAQMLGRAINNLVSNAVKYGAKDGKVKVSFQQDEQTTTVEVHNTGNPIPPEELDKLFNLYYRAKDVKARQGWGLGLTLVKGIARMHQGTVEVVSSVEQGTTFTLRVSNAS